MKKSDNKKQLFDKDQLRSFVMEQWPAYASQLNRFQWPRETERWHELVFCVVLRIGHPIVEADVARRVVNIMVDLNLLDIDTLASSIAKGGKPDKKNPDVDLMHNIMKRAGIGDQKASNIIETTCRIASVLKKQYGGKIQKYLRTYGEKMLDETGSQFNLENLRMADVRYIFSLWLQNVLNMPILLSEPALDDICTAFHANLDDLVNVADELDLNLALLDDMAADATVELENPDA
jgi:hypothetical protein